MCFSGAFLPLRRINMRNNPRWSNVELFQLYKFYVCDSPKIFLFSRLLMPAICHVLVQTTCGVMHPPEMPELALGRWIWMARGTCTKPKLHWKCAFSLRPSSENSSEKDLKNGSRIFSARKTPAVLLSARRQALNFTALPIHSKVVKQMVAL